LDEIPRRPFGIESDIVPRRDTKLQRRVFDHGAQRVAADAPGYAVDSDRDSVRAEHLSIITFC
jgi:hypothetical protein